MIKECAIPSFRNCPKCVPKRLTCYEVRPLGWLVLPRTAIGPLDFMFSQTHKLESAKAGALGEALPRGGATAGFLAEPPDPTSSPTEEANTDTVPPMGRPSVLRRLWSTREFHRTVSNPDSMDGRGIRLERFASGASAAIARSGMGRRWCSEMGRRDLHGLPQGPQRDRPTS
jgi:hypothetical protein